MARVKLTISLDIDGDIARNIVDKTVANKAESRPDPIAAAKTGTLTTRTDNDTADLTMGAGHGITTGALLDVYWNGGRRTGMTVGTVSGNTVPVDGGQGDNLPAATTAITAMVPTINELTFTGDDLKTIKLWATTPGTITVTQSDGTTVCHVFELEADGGNPVNYTYIWDVSIGSTNLLSGNTAGYVRFSHGDSTKAHYMEAEFLY